MLYYTILWNVMLIDKSSYNYDYENEETAHTSRSAAPP